MLSPYLLNLKSPAEKKPAVVAASHSNTPTFIFYGFSLWILTGLVCLIFIVPQIAPSMKVVRRLGWSVPHVETVASVLGFSGSKRYLLLFENSNELRPTGGFIGSYGVVELERGRVKSFNIPTLGTYGLQWRTPTIEPPSPLKLVNSRFEIQDANWWPDFPTSARAILAFWRSAGEKPPDGVVAITDRFIATLLKSSGGLSLENRPVVLTSDNFSDLLEHSSVSDWQASAGPRQLISEIARPLTAHLIGYARANPKAAASIFLKAMAQKDIQIYTADKDISRLVGLLGAGGVFPPFEDDGVGLVFANLNGGKTDRDIRTKIGITSRLETAWRQHDLVITRTSNALGLNRAYLRIYLPLAARVENVSGFVDPQTGGKVAPQWKAEGGFGLIEGWTFLDPSATAQITLNFQTPVPTSGVTTFRFLRQAGLGSLQFEHKIESLTPFSLSALYPRDLPHLIRERELQIRSENPPDLTYVLKPRFEGGTSS